MGGFILGNAHGLIWGVLITAGTTTYYRRKYRQKVREQAVLLALVNPRAEATHFALWEMEGS